MLSFVLFLSCIYLAAAQPAPICCTPDKWEGIMMTMSGLVREGEGHVTKAFGNISFDATAMKIAINESVDYDGQGSTVRVIQDYKAKMQYTIIDENKCDKSPADEYMPPCIPANAQKTVQSYLGFPRGPMDHLGVENYMLTQGSLTIYSTVTRHGPSECVPVVTAMYGETAGAPSMTTLVYEGITAGIANMSVFDVPSICNTVKVTHKPVRRTVFGA